MGSATATGAGESGAGAPPPAASRDAARPPASRSRPRAARTMTPCHHVTVAFLLIILQIVCAKINGGPRGRFNGTYTEIHTHPHVNAHHAHYSYHPPNHIRFICRYCALPVYYPVYHSSPPTYVYKFRESNSRYAVLLTGLSLYNLGRCCGNINVNRYTPRAEEQCSLQIIDRRHFEETRFPCFMMSSFMEQNPKIQDASLLNMSDSSLTTEEPITFDIMSANIDVKFFLSHNDSELAVSRDQDCVIWHNLTMTKERHIVSCSLLKEYAETMKPSGVPVYIWMPALLSAIVGIYIFCYCCCRKRKDKKEDQPLNPNSVYRYCSN